MERTIRANKTTIIEIVKDNRAKHRKVFTDALAGYVTRALEVVEETRKSLEQGRTPELRIQLSRPQDHTRDYDRIIKMLELTLDDEIVMDEEMIAQYVMDDWRWKRDWLRMSNRYAAASTQQSYDYTEIDED